MKKEDNRIKPALQLFAARVRVKTGVRTNHEEGER
jgi:hypothetical protein